MTTNVNSCPQVKESYKLIRKFKLTQNGVEKLTNFEVMCELKIKCTNN